MATCTKKLAKITIPLEEDQKKSIESIAANFRLPTAIYCRIVLLKAARAQGKHRLILSAETGSEVA